MHNKLALITLFLWLLYRCAGAQSYLEATDYPPLDNSGSKLHYAIQLLKNRTGKKILLDVGRRIQYSVLRNKVTHVGILSQVTDSSLFVDGKEIMLDRLSAIGRKRKNYGFLVLVLAAGGMGTILGGLEDSDYCPTCRQNDTTPGWTMAEIGLGSLALALSINTLARNSMHDLDGKWKLRVVKVGLVTVTKDPRGRVGVKSIQ